MAVRVEVADEVPTVLVVDHEVRISEPTASTVLSTLRVGGYATTTQRGSYVASRLPGVDSPQDRFRRAVRTGTITADTETQHATAAELVVAPTYIAEIYDLEPGDQVVRREYVIRSGQSVTALHVDWYPATFAVQVPTLLSTAKRTGGELLNAIEYATGRTALRATRETWMTTQLLPTFGVDLDPITCTWLRGLIPLRSNGSYGRCAGTSSIATPTPWPPDTSRCPYSTMHRKFARHRPVHWS